MESVLNRRQLVIELLSESPLQGLKDFGSAPLPIWPTQLGIEGIQIGFVSLPHCANCLYLHHQILITVVVMLRFG